MPSIGNVSVVYLKGVIHPPAMVAELLAESGVGGYGAREVARRAERSELRVTDYAETFEDAASQVASLTATQGEIVSVVDEYGLVHPNTLILAVRIAQPPRVCVRDGMERWETVFDVEAIRVDA